MVKSIGNSERNWLLPCHILKNDTGWDESCRLGLPTKLHGVKSKKFHVYNCQYFESQKSGLKNTFGFMKWQQLLCLRFIWWRIRGYIAWRGRINDRRLIIRNLDGNDRVVSSQWYRHLVGRVDEKRERNCVKTRQRQCWFQYGSLNLYRYVNVLDP